MTFRAARSEPMSALPHSLAIMTSASQLKSIHTGRSDLMRAEDGSQTFAAYSQVGKHIMYTAGLKWQA
eukprot:scaffold217598_cov17-Prasinocladus_malaysianus.AAC.1